MSERRASHVTASSRSIDERPKRPNIRRRARPFIERSSREDSPHPSRSHPHPLPLRSLHPDASRRSFVSAARSREGKHLDSQLFPLARAQEKDQGHGGREPSRKTRSPLIAGDDRAAAGIQFRDTWASPTLVFPADRWIGRVARSVRKLATWRFWLEIKASAVSRPLCRNSVSLAERSETAPVHRSAASTVSLVPRREYRARLSLRMMILGSNHETRRFCSFFEATEYQRI